MTSKLRKPEQCLSHSEKECASTTPQKSTTRVCATNVEIPFKGGSASMTGNA